MLTRGTRYGPYASQLVIVSLYREFSRAVTAALLVSLNNVIGWIKPGDARISVFYNANRRTEANYELSLSLRNKFNV